MEDKTVAQKAAERADKLDSLTEEQRMRYRERRNSQGEFMIRFEIFDYIEEGLEDDEALKEGCLLLLAAADFAKTGIMPDFVDKQTGEINKTLRRTFKSFIKPRLETSFDNYCLSCMTNESKGKKGGDETKIRKRIIELIGEKFPNTDILTADLLKDDKTAWERVGQKLQNGKDYAQKLLKQTRARVIDEIEAAEG